MTAIKIGYAPVSTDGQDLTAQRQALAELGNGARPGLVDHGISGTARAGPARPTRGAGRLPPRRHHCGHQAGPARLLRTDARDIVDELATRGVRLNLGGSLHDPTDPIGRLLFTVLSMIAEFEADLARARTRE